MQTSTILVDRLRPRVASHALLFELLVIASAAFAIALSAQLVIPLPFSPVPITLQTLTVMMLAAFLGRNRGVIAVVAYIVAGVGGIPVFSAGGMGLAKLAGPTGGYIIGFVAAAYLVGWLVERGFTSSLRGTLAVVALGTLAVFIPGYLWLAVFVGFGTAVVMGVLPFLPGAVLKAVAATTMLRLSN